MRHGFASNKYKVWQKLSYSAKPITVAVLVTDVGEGQQVADNSILDDNRKENVQSRKMQLCGAHALGYKIIYTYITPLIDTVQIGRAHV